MTLARRLNPTTKHGLVAVAILTGARVLAQQPVVPPALDPGAIQQRQMEEERRRREEEQRNRQPTAPIDRAPLKQPVQKPADNKTRFLVREITFSPSAILGR